MNRYSDEDLKKARTLINDHAGIHKNDLETTLDLIGPELDIYPQNLTSKMDTISENAFGELTQKSLSVPETYTSPRGNFPVTRPDLEWDYKPILPKEQSAIEALNKHPDAVRKADIERVRQFDPDASEHMEKLIAGSPAYQEYGDDGSSTEILDLYGDYANIIGANVPGSTVGKIVNRTPINPVPELKQYYGPQGPVWGHRKVGAPFTARANTGTYRWGWTQEGDRAKFRIGLPGSHNHIPMPPIYGKKLPVIRK